MSQRGVKGESEGSQRGVRGESEGCQRGVRGESEGSQRSSTRMLASIERGKITRKRLREG